MKLAEALINRADLKAKIAQIANRMYENAKVQEGDEPPEDMTKLISQYEELMNELEKLIIKINHTNNNTKMGEITLSEAIAKRDAIKSRINVYNSLYNSASLKQDRYSQQEIKYIRCVNLPELQNKIDKLSKQYRELDTKMQSLNWTVDLL